MQKNTNMLKANDRFAYKYYEGKDFNLQPDLTSTC